jgi:DNA-binding MarR family transcriptional regulator
MKDKHRPIHICPEIAELAENKIIHGREVMLLALIHNLSKRDGYCWAQREHLAERIGCSKQRITEIVAKLRRLNLLKEGKSNGRVRELFVILPKKKGKSITLANGVPLARVMEYHEGIEDKEKVKKKWSGVRFAEPLATKNGKLEHDDGGVLLPYMANGQIEDFDSTCAKTLRQAVRRIGKQVTWQTKNQSKQFAILRKGVDSEEIQRVLNWYCEHIEEDKSVRGPEIINPSQFRKRWDWIKNMYDKWQEEHPEEVILSKEEMVVLYRLNNLNWPKGSSKYLPRLVHLGIEEYAEFRKDLSRLLKKLERKVEKKRKRTGRTNSKDTTLPNDILKLLRSLHGPHEFIAQWYTRVFEEVCEWEKWSGNFKGKAFNISHKRFHQMCRDITPHWDTIFEEVLK